MADALDFPDKKITDSLDDFYEAVAKHKSRGVDVFLYYDFEYSIYYKSLNLFLSEL